MTLAPGDLAISLLRPAKNASRAPLRPLDLPTLGLSVGGLGFLRPAPGTWGSMPPPALIGILVLVGAAEPVLVGVTLLLLLASSAACVAWGRYAETRFGRKDAAEVVADETAGVCLPVLVALTMGDDAVAQLVGLAVAFFLFRAFDIVKPAPARQLERQPAGWGVLLDDLVAGLYAAAVLAGAYAVRSSMAG